MRSACQVKERGREGGNSLAVSAFPGSLPNQMKVLPAYASKENLGCLKPTVTLVSHVAPKARKDSDARGLSKRSAKALISVPGQNLSHKSVSQSTYSLPKSKASDFSEFASFISDFCKDCVARIAQSEEPEFRWDLAKEEQEMASPSDFGQKDSSGSWNTQDLNEDTLDPSGNEKDCVPLNLDPDNHRDGDNLQAKVDLSLVLRGILREAKDCEKTDIDKEKSKNRISLEGKDLEELHCNAKYPSSSVSTEGSSSLGCNFLIGLTSCSKNANLDESFGTLQSTSELEPPNDGSCRRLIKEMKDLCIDGVVRKDENSGSPSVEVSEGPNTIICMQDSSKRRETIASLEERVKSVASEIKRIENILDTNDLDVSKSLILDIQEKVSGIEKSIGFIMEEKVKMGISRIELSSKKNAAMSERHWDHSGARINQPFNYCSIMEMESGTGSQADNASSSDAADSSKNPTAGSEELKLPCDEKFQSNDQENKSFWVRQDSEELRRNQLIPIGMKPSTAGWFVADGGWALLAHSDGSCSYNDILHREVKSRYEPPDKVSSNPWGDIWSIHTTGSDGCTKKYVVAASAGNASNAGFCSWDFYTKEVQAFHTEGRSTTSGRGSKRRRTVLSSIVASENHKWWYKPCGPLIVSTATDQNDVTAYDIRDGDVVMKWETYNPVATMEYSSPLQWRNKDRVVIAESEAIKVWDVSSSNPPCVVNLPCSGKRISALHIHNSDAEIGGGIRKWISSSDAYEIDGVFCTSEDVNFLDFRDPSIVGFKISNQGVNVHSVFARGESIFVGCFNVRSAMQGHGHGYPMIQHFSLRRGRLMSIYSIPDANLFNQSSSLAQVWGSSRLVMAVSRRGLFTYDFLRTESMQLPQNCYANVTKARGVICPSNYMNNPSFDYAASRVLLISRDRPAYLRCFV